MDLPLPSLPTLPPELQTQILIHLSHTSPRSLHSAILTSQSLFRAGIKHLWRSPRIGPVLPKRVWRAFVEVFERHGAGKWSGVNYKEFVEVVEDVWLYVGGEDEDVEVAKAAEGVGGLNVIDTGERRDVENLTVDDDTKKLSARIEEVKVETHKLAPVNSTPFPRYSLHHCLSIMMERCPNLHTLTLHFHTENLTKLPWRNTISRIRTLDLRMRIDDSHLISIFHSTTSTTAPAAPHLKNLTLTWAELTPQSFALLQKSCPNLSSITIKLVQPRRYPSTPQPPPAKNTDLIPLALLPHITTFNIHPLPNITPSLYQSLSTHPLESLTITLSTDIPATTLPSLLPAFSSLKTLTITTPPTPWQHPIPSSLHSKTIPEAVIMELPAVCPTLTKIVLKG
ncbi:hypothetical protein HK097_006010, partial [Rhizophlyctis rosea]